LARIDASVIMATSLELCRTKAMIRAVATVLSQDGSAIPIIVVNGDRYDPEVLGYWKSRRDVRLFQLAEGNVGTARLFGRRQVDTAFFGALDDDDCFLPGSINARLTPMRTDPSVAAVVGNGLIERDGRESVALSQMKLHRISPLLGLAQENWLPSACAAMFRTEIVRAEYFDHDERWLEWTALAFRLAADERKIVFLDDLTFRIADTPDSLSKSAGYARGAPIVLRHLLDIPMPYPVYRVWLRKYGATLHGSAEFHRSRGEIGLAWKAHLGSLLQPGGAHYLLYGRKLLRARRYVGAKSGPTSPTSVQPVS
jgi:hypothetical protein